MEDRINKAITLAPDFLLTISSHDYADLVSKSLSDFEFKGVYASHFQRKYQSLDGTVLKCQGKLIEKAQNFVATVVVNVIPSLVVLADEDIKGIYMMGTALIPKKK